jgi:radical SAM superfamily enzyme YgiQ (UPF0313 family)
VSFDARSSALIDLLEELDESDLQYVLVGGYAVSTFNTRFSTDLDIVVLPEAKDAFVGFLEARGFELTDSHAKEWVYDTKGPRIREADRPTAADRVRPLGERTRVSTDRGTVVVRLLTSAQHTAGDQRRNRDDDRSGRRRCSARRGQTP